MWRGFWHPDSVYTGQNARETRGANLAGIVAESARQTQCFPQSPSCSIAAIQCHRKSTTNLL
jgi:hypothetical protein